MESWQVEQLRRSIVMLPPGHTAGAVDQAERLLDELLGMRRDNERYRALVAEHRRLLDALDVERG